MPPWLNILSTGADVAGRHTVHAADETLLTFELVIAKDGFDTGILYFCYLSNWLKQASNHMKWVRQIHGRKIVQDRHFETKAKTKISKNRSQAVSRPRPRSRGLQYCNFLHLTCG